MSFLCLFYRRELGAAARPTYMPSHRRGYTPVFYCHCSRGSQTRLRTSARNVSTFTTIYFEKYKEEQHLRAWLNQREATE
jgi:hypothetical protein